MKDEKGKLEDILLDGENKSNNKNKKTLLIVAALILLFLIVILIVRSTNKTNEQHSLVSSSNSKSFADNQDKFEQIPIVKDENLQMHSKSPIENNTQNVSEPIQNKQRSLTPPIEDTTMVKNPTRAKESKSSSSTTPTKQSHTNSGIYIQVAALFKLEPNKAFLDKIDSNGYSYILYKPTTKKSNEPKVRVLIGPFKSTSNAKMSLGDIKNKISNSAYIYKVDNF